MYAFYKTIFFHGTPHIDAKFFKARNHDCVYLYIVFLGVSHRTSESAFLLECSPELTPKCLLFMEWTAEGLEAEKLKIVFTQAHSCG